MNLRIERVLNVGSLGGLASVLEEEYPIEFTLHVHDLCDF